jgi:hypothetical protein
MMKTCFVVVASLLLSAMVASPASAQGMFKVEKGEAFNKIVPKDFVLEENAIPAEKRNSVLALTPSGGRVIAGLLDTSGYSSQVQEKYLGMLISEGNLEVCGHEVGTGSYGFGLAKAPGAAQEKASKFMLYNQAGKKVVECTADWDAKLKSPRPLQVVVTGGGTARLYVSRSWVELK